MIIRQIDAMRSAGGVLVVPGEITLVTHAQMIALPTTPLTAIAAPASGSRLRLLALSFRLNTSAGAYTNINTTFAKVVLKTAGGAEASVAIINDSTLTTPLAQVTALFASAHIRVLDIPVPAFTAIDGAGSGGAEYLSVLTGNAATTWDASAIQLTFDNNGSGNLTGGNAANTLKVTSYYATETL